jgi:hypothetical protein
MVERLPPIHDAVRFWRSSEAATLSECIAFRRTAPPGWTLAWLRSSAHLILTRKLPEPAFKRAVAENVFPEAHQSVLKAVKLLYEFACKHNWNGQTVPPTAFNLAYGPEFRLDVIGRYYSTVTNSSWLLALQPRQGNFPNQEQFRIWRSALHYEFGDTNVMIIGLSKNSVNGKRELSEITE